MIYDTLSNLAIYCPLVPQLQFIIDTMKSENLSDKVVGDYTTTSKNVRYTISECKGSPVDSHFEMHKEETIVQIVLKGKALLALTWREHAKGLPYDKEKDIVVLEGDPTAVIHAEENHFCIFFPGEPFKGGTGEYVKKALFKIKD
jgi:YhcH/YjgK/YiaL family protein